MTDQFATYDAAYLLGALSPEDRRDFEAHLRECDTCSASVTRLSGLPGLLRGAPRPDLAEDPGPVPESLLPGLLTEVARRRTNRRRLAFVAAAAAAVVAVLFGTYAALQRPEPARGIEMSAVAADAPVHAEAVLDAKPWGTHIRLHCWYDAAATYWGGDYRLVVTDDDGTAQQLATWTVVPGETSTVDGSTALDLEQIATVEVRSATDTVVLTLSP